MSSRVFGSKLTPSALRHLVTIRLEWGIKVLSRGLVVIVFGLVFFPPAWVDSNNPPGRVIHPHQHTFIDFL